MVLKESFTYQNALTSLIESACAYLSTRDNVTIKTQTHNRKKVYDKAEDEVIVANQKNEDNTYENNKVIELLETLMTEKITLSEAIAKAKATADFDIDAAIESNKLRQRAAHVFKNLSGIQASERDTEGVAYAWNQEQNQVSYRYPIKEVVTIDFDRNKTKSLYKKMATEADEISTKIDRLNATIEVDFAPKFDMHDTFREVYTSFVENNSVGE